MIDRFHPSASRARRTLLLVAALSLVLSSAAVAAPAGPPSGVVTPDGSVITDSYLVIVDAEHPGSVAFDHARRHGVELAFIYEHAVTGYAATMSATAAQAIARDPRVVRVEQETMESITAQELPTGVDRIETDRNPTVSTDGTGGDAVTIDVAVLDTGVNDHPDLNLATSTDCTVTSGGGPFASYSCQTGTSADDTNGHGTHVAGTVAAKNNGSGVVGVAPGAPVHSVKVCPGNSCPTGAIIAGIDHLVEQKRLYTSSGGSDGIDLAVANFSISSADSNNSCASPANTTHAAICSLVGEGVSFVMAAGNDGREKVPYPVALSVAAIADFDGVAGGAGAATCRDDDDDTLADFSNFGEGVRIAAPGVCIESTWFDGSYNTISGTSMAAPHAAGAYALYLHANDLDPAGSATEVRDIEESIIGAALPQGTSAANPCSYDDARPGGPLLFVNAEAFGGDGSCGVAGEDDGSGGDDGDDGSGGDDGDDGSGGDDGDDGEGPGDIELTVAPYKVQGVKHVDLAFSGISDAAPSVEVTRDGTLIATVEGASTYTDRIGTRGGGSYDYQVCETGTATCSSIETATF
jgi:subtilisin